MPGELSSAAPRLAGSFLATAGVARRSAHRRVPRCARVLFSYATSALAREDRVYRAQILFGEVPLCSAGVGHDLLRACRAGDDGADAGSRR